MPRLAENPTSSQLELTSPAGPEQVAHLLHEEPGFIWLDGNTSRHYFFYDPVAVISCDGTTAAFQGDGGTVQLPASSLEALELMLHLGPDSAGFKLAGYIAYDVGSELERLNDFPTVGTNLPRLRFGLYDAFLTYNAGKWVISGTDAWRGGQGWSRFISSAGNLLQRAERVALPDIEHEHLSAVLTSSANTQDEFVRSVDRIIDRIRNGDFFQTNLCRYLEASIAPRSEWSLYRKMRQLSPADYGAFLQWGAGESILSVSPELFLQVKDRAVISRPIKGTRPRGATPEKDQLLQQDLLGSSKDRAELSMIVDVTRNDLSRVSEPGSVQVLEHASLMTLPTLHHTYSQITGRLQKTATLTDLLRASFPPASITGAPKIAAMQGAFQEERRARGPCMGSIGWISSDGELELSVAIRTAYTQSQKVTYLAGCGITYDSSPSAELAESQVKAAAFLRALGLKES